MYKIQLTESFQNDIEKILIYSIDTFGQSQADKYYENLFLTIEKIARMPSIGHSRKDIPSYFRSYIYSQHSLLYTADDKNMTATFARVLHSHMDFTQKL